MEYIGEHLLPGKIGQLFVVLSFIFSLLALFSYTFSTLGYEERKVSYKRLGRLSFGLHALAVLGIIVTLFYIIYSHYFEYHYAWSHSSKALPTHYIISCFWEGQEGSFLLWTFWHALLGLVLFKAGKWEAPVLSVISLAQVMLSSMLLGYYILGVKIGSSPFLLLREVMAGAPVFADANYLSKYILDGNGLNPLLQNYWMVIHPPVTFLGFASTIVPFAFAISAMWRREYRDWIRPALPWALFGVVVLGTGIIMGGMWAYEALSFGGYWAWDPVENASLVPWLTLIAGVHVMVVNRYTGKALTSSYVFIIATFLLVLYATFLTRSGILGESSVHAFTDLGLSGQLLLFLFLFVGLSVGMSFDNRKHRLFFSGVVVAFYGMNIALGRFLTYPNLVLILVSIGLIFYNLNKKSNTDSASEDNLLSREFWLYIGSLVLCISAIHISFVTSFPVFNKMFGLNLAPPADAVASYNRVQLPIAIIIILLTVVGMGLRYRTSNLKAFVNRLLIPLGIAALFSAILAYVSDYREPLYLLLLFAALFGFFGNLSILIRNKQGLIKSGGSIAHIGFAMMLVGILYSSAKQHVISINTLGVNYGENFDARSNFENILLWKNEPTMMGRYRVTYLGDSVEEPNTYYLVQSEELDENGDVLDVFTLSPNAQVNPKMGLLANPDTRHFVSKDLFTHVSQVLDKEAASRRPEYEEPVSFKLNARGDTMMYSGMMIYFDGISPSIPNKFRSKVSDAEIALSARLRVRSGLKDSSSAVPGSSGEILHELNPVMAIKDNLILNYEDENEAAGLKAELVNFDPQSEVADLSFSRKTQEAREYIIMKAIIFPWINLLWLGLVILIIGFALAIVHRYRENKISGIFST